MLRKTVERRLAYLSSGEQFSFFLFIPTSYIVHLAFPSLQLYSLASFWAAFILLEILLLQGVYYWRAKLKRLRVEQSSITPTPVVVRLHRLKKVNAVLIAFVLLALGYDIAKWYPNVPVAGVLLALFIYIFAILEYVNYFYIQLSYDNQADIKGLLKRKTLKISPLHKDFKRLKL